MLNLVLVCFWVLESFGEREGFSFRIRKIIVVGRTIVVFGFFGCFLVVFFVGIG